MIMRRKLLLTVALLSLSFGVFAQSGKNYLQVSAQLSRPTSALLEVTNIGYGGALKWMHGFGERKQQVTLEAGYNRFPVKGLPSGVEAHYSAIPIYLGYRYLANRISLEAQGGASINRIIGRNNMFSVSETKLNLGIGLGLGYTMKNFEISARYQITDPRGTEDDPTFLGIRLAYNISL